MIDAAGGTLQIVGKTVAVPAGTPITHAGTMLTLLQLHVGDEVQVKGTPTGAATVTASSIDVKATNPNHVELTGAISGRSGSCPSITFTLAGRTVTTDVRTEFDDTKCTALANGDSVKVEGNTQSNGTVAATEIELVRPGDPHGEQVELFGSISGLSGSCPSLTFTVTGRTVTTDAKTEFDDTRCTALTNGASVKVEGTMQSSGIVLARDIELVGTGDSEIKLTGSVSGLSGMCRPITFTLAGRTVTTDARTEFDDVPCSALANADLVEVEGKTQANGTVLATEIDRKNR